MDNSTDLPGTSQQQQMLLFIVDFYAQDERILAILLFGSLERGNGDEYSDLDLDIIMADGTPIDARFELANLCAAIKEVDDLEAIIIADIEEGDVVLSNLLEFSIRYHLLNDTKPAILDSMRRLAGALTLDEIREAANQEYLSVPPEMVEIVDQCLRYTLGLQNAILRQRLWMSLEMLQRIRGLLMSMYGVTHGAERPLHFFESHASPELQDLLAGLIPRPSLKSVGNAFRHVLSLLQNDLDRFSSGQYELTEGQKRILRSLIQRQLSMKG